MIKEKQAGPISSMESTVMSLFSAAVCMHVCESETGQFQVFVMSSNKSCLPPEHAVVWHGQ